MPNKDGTGPKGLGSGIGRGMGSCVKKGKLIGSYVETERGMGFCVKTGRGMGSCVKTGKLIGSCVKTENITADNTNIENSGQGKSGKCCGGRGRGIGQGRRQNQQ